MYIVGELCTLCASCVHHVHYELGIFWESCVHHALVSRIHYERVVCIMGICVYYELCIFWVSCVHHE